VIVRFPLVVRPFFREENGQTDDGKQAFLKCGWFRYGIRLQ